MRAWKGATIPMACYIALAVFPFARLMKITLIALAIGAVLLPNVARAWSEVPLAWRSVSITSDDRGGVFVHAAVNDDGQLKALDVAIKGRLIDIPGKCLAGLHAPYLAGLELTYGQWQSGGSYWSLRIPYDGTGSVELGARFNLVFSEATLVWSYTSVEVEREVWEDTDVCPLSDLR